VARYLFAGDHRRAIGLEWHETETIYPFFGLRRFPNQQQVFDSSAYIEFLRHDDKARTRSRFPKSRKVTWHRFSIMGNEDSAGTRGHAQHFRVG
jgi:hypothetical protein